MCHGMSGWTQILEVFTFLSPGPLPILQRDTAEKQRIKATCLPLTLTFLAQHERSLCMTDSPCERERKSLTALRRRVRSDNEDESDLHLLKTVQ